MRYFCFSQQILPLIKLINMEFIHGYKYFPYKDIMKLAKIDVDSKANSHRLILSETAKVFDILSFTIPVTVRSKSLLSNLWNLRKSGGTWDKVVSEDILRIWAKLAPDLERLSELEFPRYSMNQEKPNLQTLSYSLMLVRELMDTSYIQGRIV